MNKYICKSKKELFLNQFFYIMNTTLKIFLSAALGALIGSLVALELTSYLWWIGAIVGGLAGYLAYEIHRIPRAVKNGFEQILNFRPDYKMIRRFFLAYLGGLSISYTFSIICCIGLLNTNTAINSEEIVLFSVIYLPLFLSVCALLAILAATLPPNEQTDENIRVIRESHRRLRMVAIKYLNPLAFPFTIIYLIVKSITKNHLRIISFIKKSLLFMVIGFWLKLYFLLKFIFIQIHSDVRVICMIGAAIGSIIGYIFQNPILGAIVGGIMGILSYQIISVRILKLKSKS